MLAQRRDDYIFVNKKKRMVVLALRPAFMYPSINFPFNARDLNLIVLWVRIFVVHISAISF